MLQMSKVLMLIPNRHGDHRGFFAETYNRRRYLEFGIDVDFVQDNHSLSKGIGKIRGLYFQAPPCAQAKLVRCGRGAIFDVAVGIRKVSPTYSKWEGYELSAENGHQFYVPVGFAHGFATLERYSEIIYKCSDYYAPETEGSLAWNDPSISIDWPSNANSPTISAKDSVAPVLADFDSPFIYGYNS